MHMGAFIRKTFLFSKIVLTGLNTISSAKMFREGFLINHSPNIELNLNATHNITFQETIIRILPPPRLQEATDLIRDENEAMHLHYRFVKQQMINSQQFYLMLVVCSNN